MQIKVLLYVQHPAAQKRIVLCIFKIVLYIYSRGVRTQYIEMQLAMVLVKNIQYLGTVLLHKLHHHYKGEKTIKKAY